MKNRKSKSTINSLLFSIINVLGVCIILFYTNAEGQTTSNLQPQIIPREAWLATAPAIPSSSDPSCSQSNGTLSNVFIHHTSDESSTAESLSNGNEYVWVQLIQRFQMAGNPLRPGSQTCDIAYHYLIGPSGAIFEGRKGGIHTKGSHLDGMNTGTIGIAMLGNYNNNIPTPSAQLSLQKLLIWLLMDNQLEPDGLNYVVSGNYFSPVISGHRHMNWSPLVDNHTSCPGDALFNFLPTLRKRVNTQIRNLEGSNLFKMNNNSTVYRVRNNVKEPFTSSYVFNSYFGDRWDLVRVNDALLNSKQTGRQVPFRDGTLIGYSDRPSNGTIFVVYNGQKRAFTSWDYFLKLGNQYQLGYSADQIMRVPAAIIDNLPNGPNMVDIVICNDCRNT